MTFIARQAAGALGTTLYLYHDVCIVSVGCAYNMPLFVDDRLLVTHTVLIYSPRKAVICPPVEVRRTSN